MEYLTPLASKISPKSSCQCNDWLLDIVFGRVMLEKNAEGLKILKFKMCQWASVFSLV